MNSMIRYISYIFIRNYLLKKEIYYQLHTKIRLVLEELHGEPFMLLNKKKLPKVLNIAIKLKHIEKLLKRN